MKLYFGNAVTAATTLMILALLGFIGYSVINRVNIQCWGRRSAALLVFGLVICCFAAARDGLDKTIQRAYRCRLCRCTADYNSRCRHAYCKDTTCTRGLVLCDVVRCSAENRDG